MERPSDQFKRYGVRAVAVAKAIGVTPGAITQWEKVPAERVVDVEKASGIPREKLRPDLFAPPLAHAPAHEGAQQ